MTNIMKWLDGNKSIILLSIANALQQAVVMNVIANTAQVQYVVWLLFAISGGAIWQHVQKGYFTTNTPVPPVPPEVKP